MVGFCAMHAVPTFTMHFPPFGHLSCLPSPEYYISGAIAIFSRMNIGTLDVGDFLGKPSLRLPLHALGRIMVSPSSSFSPLIIAAIGAIFSATDSVCTLQVGWLVGCWNNLMDISFETVSCLLRGTWSLLSKLFDL
jgi:hypothetical protein